MKASNVYPSTKQSKAFVRTAISFETIRYCNTKRSVPYSYHHHKILLKNQIQSSIFSTSKATVNREIHKFTTHKTKETRTKKAETNEAEVAVEGEEK